MIEYPIKKSLGADVQSFPKTQYEKIVEIIDAVNDLQDGDVTLEDLHLDGTLEVDGVSTFNNDILTDAIGENTPGSGIEILNTLSCDSDLLITGLLALKGTLQTLTGAGAVNLTTKTTLLVTTGSNALTLANSTLDGQIKIIIHKTDGGDGTLTPTTLRGGTTITFSAVGQTATLLWKDSTWNVIALVGAILA